MYSFEVNQKYSSCSRERDVSVITRRWESWGPLWWLPTISLFPKYLSIEKEWVSEWIFFQAALCHWFLYCWAFCLSPSWFWNHGQVCLLFIDFFKAMSFVVCFQWITFPPSQRKPQLSGHECPQLPSSPSSNFHSGTNVLLVLEEVLSFYLFMRNSSIWSLEAFSHHQFRSPHLQSSS